MKLVILGDAHFGARNSNQVIQRWQRKFYEECFWPYIKENNISTVIQTGDFFDNRKWLNVQTLAFMNETFVKPSQDLGVEVYGIVGNHDIPLRHSLANSTPVQVLNHEPNIHFYDTLQELDFDGVKFTMMPWICRENSVEMVDRLEEGGDVLIGHFEIQKFLMHAGAYSHDGLTKENFANWNQVLSGHYHAQSVQDNIRYVGTPYQMMWSDATTRHGFWVFDTTDKSVEFIENPFRYFNRFIWEDQDIEVGNLEDTYVKVNVKKKTDFEAFEKFVDRINARSPFELKIIEQFEEYNSENVNDMIKVADTTELLQEYIDDVGSDHNKEAIKEIMLEIYEEAQRVDEGD